MANDQNKRLCDENDMLRARNNDLMNKNRDLEIRLSTALNRPVGTDNEISLSHQKRAINESSNINLYYDPGQNNQTHDRHQANYSPLRARDSLSPIPQNQSNIEDARKSMSRSGGGGNRSMSRSPQQVLNNSRSPP